MTEEELKEKFARMHKYGKGDWEYDIAKDEILTAFAELRAERDAALEREKLLWEAVEESWKFMIFICASHKGSMGSIDNVYLPQVDRKQADELLLICQRALGVKP